MPAAARRVERAADAQKHCRVERAEPIRHLVVAAINGQRVLHEVVGAETEEVNLARELSATSTAEGTSIIAPMRRCPASFPSLTSRARSSSMTARARRTSVTSETIGSTRSMRPRAAARRTARACVRSTSGCCRQKRIARRPERGVALLAHFGAGPRQLVAAEVEEADGHALVARDARQLLVGLALLLLVRHRAAVREQELRTEKTDTARAVAVDPLVLDRQLDVRAQRHLDAVTRPQWRAQILVGGRGTCHGRARRAPLVADAFE